MKKPTRSKIVGVMNRVSAEIVAAALRPGDFIEQYPFTLPEHTRWPASRKRERPKNLVHVTGEIYRWPEIKIQPAAAEPLNTDEDVKRALHAYCSPMVDKGVVTAAAEAEIALSNLAMLARNGNGKALWQFANLTCQLVESLNEIARSNPAAIKPFARLRANWPMMRSTHPFNCENEKLLDDIELGKSTGVLLDKFSRWKPDYASKVAHALRNHIEFIRRENPVGWDGKREIEFSKFLPAYNKDTAPHWWFIAEKFLLAAYPRAEFHKITELNEIVTSPTKQTKPGKIATAALIEIRQRFLHMPCQS